MRATGHLRSRVGRPSGGGAPAPIARLTKKGQVFIRGIRVSYADRDLTCRECGQNFTFTAGEQEFYATHGLVNDPSRCPDCRAQRRASQGGYAYRPNGGEYGREREMFSATCSNCGKEALVPFQPRTDRPVYCSDCFQQVRGQRPSFR